MEVRTIEELRRKLFVGQELESLSVLQTQTGLTHDALLLRWEQENAYREQPSKRPPGNPEIAKEQRRLSCWRPARTFEAVAQDHYKAWNWINYETVVVSG